MYQVDAVSTRIKRELRRIRSAEDREKVIDAIESLGSNPRPTGIVQLAPNIYRLRVGDYRVIYKVFDDDSAVLIGKVDRRSEDTYRSIGRLFG
jgi:mRNA interferase RelE/StbE